MNKYPKIIEGKKTESFVISRYKMTWEIEKRIDIKIFFKWKFFGKTISLKRYPLKKTSSKKTTKDILNMSLIYKASKFMKGI